MNSLNVHKYLTFYLKKTFFKNEIFQLFKIFDKKEAIGINEINQDFALSGA